MSENERHHELAMAYLDGQLSPEDRATIAALREQGPDFDRLLADYRADEALLQSLRVDPGVDLTRSIMSQIQPRPSRFAGGARYLALAACLLLAASASYRWQQQDTEMSPLQLPELAQSAVTPPAQTSGTPVTFQLAEDEAGRVELIGTFNDWGQRPIVMSRDNDRFSVTVQLPPGEHEYQFLIDGQRFLMDPNAIRSRVDGFGQRNSVVVVSPAQS